MKIRTKLSPDKVHHAEMEASRGTRIRLVAFLTNDGWNGGILDLNTREWLSLGQWRDLETAKSHTEGFARITFGVSGDFVWFQGLPKT